MKYIHPLIESKETCLSRMPNVAKRFEEVHGMNGDQFYELIKELVLSYGNYQLERKYSDMVDECDMSRNDYKAFWHEAWIPKIECNYHIGPLPYQNCDLWKIEKAYWADTEKAQGEYMDYCKAQMKASLPRTSAQPPKSKRSKAPLVFANSNSYRQEIGTPLEGTHYEVGPLFALVNRGQWKSLYYREGSLQIPDNYLPKNRTLKELLSYCEQLSVLIDWSKFSALTDAQKYQVSEEMRSFKNAVESASR